MQRADPFGGPPSPPAPLPPTSLAPAGGSAQPPAALGQGGDLEALFRSADLGVRDPTLDDAGRIAALRRFGLAKLDRASLMALVNQVRS